MTNSVEHNVTSTARRTTLQAGALLAGEVVGSTAGLITLSQVEKLEKSAPGFVGFIKSCVKTCIVKPLHTPLEWCFGYTRGIEGDKQYEARMALSEDKREDKLTNAVFNYGIAGLAAYGTMYGVGRQVNKMLGVPIDHKNLMKVLGIDGAVHLGAIVLMSTPALAPTTQNAKHAMSCVFKSFGVDPKKADEMAHYGVVIEVPNYLGFAAQVATVHSANRRLAQQLAVHSPHIT